jgi:hypothetical protein
MAISCTPTCWRPRRLSSLWRFSTVMIAPSVWWPGCRLRKTYPMLWRLSHPQPYFKTSSMAHKVVVSTTFASPAQEPQEHLFKGDRRASARLIVKIDVSSDNTKTLYLSLITSPSPLGQSSHRPPHSHPKPTHHQSLLSTPPSCRRPWSLPRDQVFRYGSPYLMPDDTQLWRVGTNSPVQTWSSPPSWSPRIPAQRQKLP